MANERQAWIVGGGIAGLAAAALLIRDGDFRGANIHVLEQADVFGGSLDATGSPEHGYLMRGGRMLEPHYVCTYDLFDAIPAPDGTGRSVTRSIRDFTHAVTPSSHCRLVRQGQCIDAPPLGLAWRDRTQLVRLLLRSEGGLGVETIEQYFRPGFFATPFWLMWSTMFAFQPWHSLAELRRYLLRFMHLMPGFSRLEGIDRTPLNQYDSLIRPLQQWLREHAVDLRPGCRVTAVDFDRPRDPSQLTALRVRTRGTCARIIALDPDDIAFITLGSMTENSTIGSHAEPAALNAVTGGGAWELWRDIAAHSSRFGRPDAFCTDIARSKWLSFTVTQDHPAFFDHMESFTGNAPGTGGVVTFADSSWRLSVVLAHQPHFANQPPHIRVFWGFGLFPDRDGDHVRKPMDACTGAELLTELAGQLGIRERFDSFFGSATCIPCQMPYVTSQFMPRAPGDRPRVVPEGARNFAFLGQFCEAPRDTVFTVEYSVRTAQMAVYALLGLDRQPLPLYRGDLDAAVVWRAARAILT